MIVDYTNPTYRAQNISRTLWNGAYFYSKEIVHNIMPNVVTDRSWITINVPEEGACDHAIVFIHNNLQPERKYEWLRPYKDLVMVCGIPETCERVAHLGTPIYLPLSIDVADVEQYRRPKKKDVAFVGRRPKRRGITFPENTDFIEGLPRPELLAKMAEYRYVFAVGRTALEAKVLGCNLLAYDPRFPDVERWKVMDNSEAAVILQRSLDEIDK